MKQHLYIDCLLALVETQSIARMNKKYPELYEYAKDHSWLVPMTEELQVVPLFVLENLLIYMKDAQQYDNTTQWRVKSHKMFTAAKRQGLLHEVQKRLGWEIHILDIPTDLNTKMCSRCHEYKHVTHFSKNKIGRLGVNSRCRDCIKIVRLLKQEGR